MSRIGKMPVVIPNGVQVGVSGGVVTAKGPKGELKHSLHPLVKAEIKDGKVFLSADLTAARDASAIYGMSRVRINNLVTGVSAGFSKVLEIVGLGFRAEVSGQKLSMTLGKSHPVTFEAPKGVVVSVDPKKTQLTVSGASKDLVGEVAAKIRELRKPEPYKGTGIRYAGERVRKKAGKTAAGAGAGAGAGAKK
ncbi:MAG: 50S ribosomal protein L6 [Elusimicrobia bacterium]|nr:50S ribosomal protein L6 [Elusimicrobiota bacterium]MDE2236412.1 50S ribosomal protein L6 [Elusimicrobiota bacterium]MDE2425325.1 50S ribosomal protein L6 [Elusimicrobiota bacterium]